MLLKQTKIVATISDQRCDVDFIKQLFEAGMNVVRMNTAHLNREGFERLIGNVRAVSNRIAILMDTKGPEVRTTPLAGEPISFKTGDRVKVVGNPELQTTRECISVSYPNFVQDLNVGGHILIDDGDMEMVVIEKHADYLLCEMQNDTTLGSRKSVNVPGVRINLPSLTEKDRNNILYAIEKDIDFIAHSFVRNKQDILDIKSILDAHGSDIRIIAKIENQEGVDNIDEILEVADGVMVARGDLGIEVPQERIPGIQRVLIRKCILAKKPVIVATQMLHTMISNPRPT
ncbi:pyruvate kinase, partial [Bacteroides heparinolyticus]